MPDATIPSGVATADADRERGLESHAQGDLHGAIESYTRALHVRPADAITTYARALAHQTAVTSSTRSKITIGCFASAQIGPSCTTIGPPPTISVMTFRVPSPTTMPRSLSSPGSRS